MAFDAPAPEQRHRDEDTAVHRVNPAEMRDLQRRDDAVERESEAADESPPRGPTVAQPFPDEPSAADFAQPAMKKRKMDFRISIWFSLVSL